MSRCEPTRVLVTGVGGPAGLGFLRLAARPDVKFFTADMNPYAAGLHLTPPARRLIVPPGDDPAFVDEVLKFAIGADITVVVPTVDAELLPLARRAGEFSAAGITVVGSSPETLERCLDKAALAELLIRHGVRVPETEVIGPGTDITPGSVVKPRRGSGSRGVRVVTDVADVAAVPRDRSYLVQEMLPGEELSVDVFVRRDGAVVAAVPRTRDHVDSGVAVAGRSRRDPDAAAIATRVAEVTGVRGVANVQLRRNRHGELAVLEVNPRLPGSLTLTAAAGANLAGLLLAEALGEPIPDHLTFREVAMVRFLTDLVIEVDDYPVVPAPVIDNTVKGPAA
ncbi:MAG: ATP-grasp domain-containing protein [Desertimonas sp.]